MDKGLHCIKMGADSLAENTPNAPESAQFVCPSPKVLDFNEKKASLSVRSPCNNPFRNYESELLPFSYKSCMIF